METDGVTFYREAMVPIDDFFQDCSFAGEEVNCSALIDIVLTLTGFCYRVSSKNFPETVFERPGHRFGIGFEINVHEYEYGGQAQTAGVGVQVHLRLC